MSRRRRGFTGRIGEVIDDTLDRASDVEHDVRRAARTAVENRYDRWDDDWDGDDWDDWDDDWDGDDWDGEGRSRGPRGRGRRPRPRRDQGHPGRDHSRGHWHRDDTLEEILEALEELNYRLRRCSRRRDDGRTAERRPAENPGAVTDRIARMEDEVQKLSRRSDEAPQ
jgi:hypothetical protein